jgi:hypothetical protein
MSLSVSAMMEYLPGGALKEITAVLKGRIDLIAIYLLGSKLATFSLGLILPFPILMASRPIPPLCYL